MPTREEDTYVLSKYRSEFEPHVTGLWPPYESLAIAQDGYRLAKAAEEVDIPVPKTELLDDVDDWNRELIVKQRYAILTSDYTDSLAEHECEGGGQEPIYLETSVEPDKVAITEAFLGETPIVQECTWGTEYSYRALFDHGEPVATSLRKQIRGKTYAGGASVYREMTHDETVEGHGRRLLEHLDWHGLATVQFMKDRETGEFKLLEINPRIWGSILLDVRAGADYPYNYWLLATGQRDRIDPTYEVGVASHLLFGELKYLSSVLRDDFPNVERPTFAEALREVGSSLYHQPNFDYLNLRDPRPFAHGVLNTLSIEETVRRLRGADADEELPETQSLTDDSLPVETTDQRMTSNRSN
ncbi:ATP-grasp domain-containing protein [Haloprofundus salilacus]|uniref:carboxylate--amine ligase n=1 Tax=Haloprofundus salilacus TaxID=2876190 RepID=UPI001CCEA49A|nr:ATP-grasp domain-containing protein [Haloprofundus salilacus]